ncbi:MAG: hypothetical protein AAB250_09155, partial [Bdellovibrionota bacterium]
TAETALPGRTEPLTTAEILPATSPAPAAKRPSAPPVVLPAGSKPVKAPKAPSAPSKANGPKVDRAATAFSKCMYIENLSKRNSAIRCLDRILDRTDIEVGNIETRLMNCGEIRRLEKLEKGEEIRKVVIAEMMKLRAAQTTAIEQNVRDEVKAGVKVGPRKMKEIEIRAADAHGRSVEKLADLVCSRTAFEMFMARK